MDTKPKDEMPKTKKPVIPEHAYVKYGTPTSLGREGTLLWFKTEEKARDVAAGHTGDGSGRIIKITRWSEDSKGDDWKFSVQHELEETLPVVTNFDSDGAKRHAAYVKKRDCKHENTRADKGGAGCNTWVDVTCVDCKQMVA